MGQSVLVFISHSSEDKEDYIEPIINDLEDCFINVWLDKKKILPGDNLRKSIFRDGLDKADVVLIFFTEQAIKSRWVDREIKHVLREEKDKGNDFDLKKVISIYDSQKTYDELTNKYPELTDDLLHLMPRDYDKIQFGQLVSAIWSKYLSLQGGDIETQKQLLAKDKELFQKDKEILELKTALEQTKLNNKENSQEAEFERYLQSGKLDNLLKDKELIKELILSGRVRCANRIDFFNAKVIGLIDSQMDFYYFTDKGKEFFKWYILNHADGE